MTQLDQLPDNLPVPKDDGACQHLLGMALPNLTLTATNGDLINLGTADKVVVYCYPMTGRPDVSLPDNWDEIPGARGCTPQSCAFADHYQELQNLGADVFGLSTQTIDYQLEAKTRLHLPFELLSDHTLAFAQALNLPTMQVDGMTLIKRLTFIVAHGRIVQVFYPVFPPQRNAQDVIAFLSE